MEGWREKLRLDPLPLLLSYGNKVLVYFVRRDLLEEKVDPIETLWQLPSVEKILKNQQEDGSWKYHGGKSYIRSQKNYNQLETYRILGQLVELYGLNRKHPAIRKAADFLFEFQTEEGDFRGIYQNQYTPNYTAAIMELLIKAGYEENSCIEKGFTWLLSIRQNDGGWAIPFRTIGSKGSGALLEVMKKPEPVKPDKSKPFSHCITGVVLRALAAHQDYRKLEEARVAGELLKSRFFQPDKYPDRRAADFWTKFTFPFWFTDLLSALDSLSLLGFTKDDPQIEKALKWLSDRQQENGLWKLTLLKAKSIEDLPLWISLAVCRIFKRFYK
ncbi:MAG: hypothetical protein H3Z50_04365 [archaeon]|nr:hypothetical protein [archaeon]MCP8305671.1 hypothetical protein [archaeon]